MSKKMPKSSNKELDKLVKKAIKAGWRWKEGNGGHIKLFSPDKKTIAVISVSTRHPRAVREAKKSLQIGGLKV
jgi:hypothetical protein